MLEHHALTERVSLRGRAKLAYAGLFAIGAVHVIAAMAGMWLLVLIGRLQAGEPVSQTQLQSVVSVADQLETAYWVGMAFAATTFLMWFHRAYKNASYTGGATKGPGMAIAGWFIPFANLVIPYTLAAEIWTGSAPHPSDANPQRGLWLLRVWWGLWIVSGILGTLMLRDTATNDIESLISLQYKAVVINGLRAVAAVFAILVVKRITERQGAATVAPARIVDAG